MRFVHKVAAERKHGPINVEQSKKLAAEHKTDMKNILKLIEAATARIQDNEEIFDSEFSNYITDHAQNADWLMKNLNKAYQAIDSIVGN